MSSKITSKKLYFQFKRNSFKNLFDEEDIINILNQRYTINGENLLITYINGDVKKVDSDIDLIKLFDFIIVGKKNCDIYNEYPFLRLYEIRNTKIIDIIMRLEHEHNYDKSTDKYIIMYYVEIDKEFEEYIEINYDFCDNIHKNEYGLLNDYIQQYIIINKKDMSPINYVNSDDFEYDVLNYYLNYDKFIKNCFDNYITTIQQSICNISNLEILKDTFNQIINNNNIRNYIKYEVIY